MSDSIAAPTSMAATRDTEPEVVAAISSADGAEDQLLNFRTDRAPGIAGPLLLMAAAALFGFGAYRFLRRRR